MLIIYLTLLKITKIDNSLVNKKEKPALTHAPFSQVRPTSFTVNVYLAIKKSALKTYPQPGKKLYGPTCSINFLGKY